MGIGNPKTGEEQEAEYNERKGAVAAQYKEAQARRISSDQHPADSLTPNVKEKAAQRPKAAKKAAKSK